MKGSGTCNQRQLSLMEQPDKSNLEDLIKASQKKRTVGAAGGERSSFSVTELELYAKCPKGWFSNYLAENKQPFRIRTYKGTIYHSLLQNSVDLAKEERLEYCQTKIQENDKLKPNEKLDMLGKIKVILNNFYPYEDNEIESFSEKSLKVELESGYTLKGKIDRIDIIGDNALIVDYKLSFSKNLYARNYNNLQRYLYSYMASNNLNKNPAGMLYYSLENNDWQGWINNSLTDINKDFTNYKWVVDEKLDNEVILEHINKLIQGIINGDWERQGENCPSWCNCKLLEDN